MLAKEPIFIIGPSRTASKLYRAILNNHPEIHITHEINYRFRLKNDIYKLLKEYSDDISYISSYMLNNLKYFPFLNQMSENEREEFKAEMDKLESPSDKELLDFLLAYNAKNKKKKYWGGKFPVHYSYLGYLLRYYPNAKVIFLTRDLRAIYASEKIKKQDFKRHKGSQWPRIKIKSLNILLIYFYCLLEWTWSTIIYKKYSKKYNIKLYEYEKLITMPEQIVYDICDFVGIKATSAMLQNVSVIGSSYNSQNNKDLGFKKEAIYRWKEELNWFEKTSLTIWMKFFT
jgi:hypothetical protein